MLHLVGQRAMTVVTMHVVAEEVEVLAIIDVDRRGRTREGRLTALYFGSGAVYQVPLGSYALCHASVDQIVTGSCRTWRAVLRILATGLDW